MKPRVVQFLVLSILGVGPHNAGCETWKSGARRSLFSRDGTGNHMRCFHCRKSANKNKDQSIESMQFSVSCFTEALKIKYDKGTSVLDWSQAC